MNNVTVAGVLQKLWGRGRDVFARLRVSQRGLLAEPEDVHACYVTLRFPEGSVGGKPVTLQPNATVRVNGFLTHTEIDETIRKFLEAAGVPDLLNDVPPEDLDAWREIGFRRRSAVLNVLSLAMLDTEGQVLEAAGQGDEMSLDILNQAALEGVIAQTWEYQRNGGVDRFARLAVYDCHTRTEDREGNFGRPRRKPHYITVLFPAGKTTGGHEVQVSEKSRIRVVGELHDLGQRVTLHDALTRTGKSHIMELIQRLHGAERLHDISTQWETIHVRAGAVIVYTAGRSRKKK
jgi:hypothetical protein